MLNKAERISETNFHHDVHSQISHKLSQKASSDVGYRAEPHVMYNNDSGAILEDEGSSSDMILAYS